jgi:hypothetical protein
VAVAHSSSILISSDTAMSLKKYTVVQFLPNERKKEVEVEIVPSSWIKFDTKRCAWPQKSGAALNTLQKSGKSPDSTWKEFPYDKILYSIIY